MNFPQVTREEALRMRRALQAAGLVCYCGSGGHPRPCKMHPEEYEKHLAELNFEAEIDSALDSLRGLRL